MHDDSTKYSSARVADLGDGVLEVTMSAPCRLSAVGLEGHRHLAEVWTTIDRDPDVKVAIIRGEGGVPKPYSPPTSAPATSDIRSCRL